MKDFIADEWQAILTHNQLTSFESIWQLSPPWFEPPNYRRGGWSGVAYLQLQRPEGGHIGVFLKRQQNHFCKTLRHPFRGIPTFARELKNIFRFRAASIPTLEPIYYAERDANKNMRVILMTEELTGYQSLERWSQQWAEEGWPALPIKNKILQTMASVIQRMHSQRIRHGCLYAKHLFLKINPQDNSVDVRMIDLEKAKRSLRLLSCQIRELAALHKHTPCWRVIDRMRFFNYYFNVQQFNKKARQLWRAVEKRSRR